MKAGRNRGCPPAGQSPGSHGSQYMPAMQLLPLILSTAGAVANVDWENSSPGAARGLLGDDPVVVPAPSASPTVDAPDCSCKSTWSNSYCSNQEGCPPTTCDTWSTNWCEVEPAGCDGSTHDLEGFYWMECDQSTPVGSSAPTVSPDLGDAAPKAQFLAPAAFAAALLLSL